MKHLIRVRRRVATIAVLLGFCLVAMGAAHVNSSINERQNASDRADVAARQWHRQIATELTPTDAAAWRADSANAPLLILEAISITEPEQ